MKTLTEEQIKEIAEQLDCGFRCFWSKKTGKLIFIPDTLKYPETDLESWEEEIKILDDNSDNYLEIQQLEFHDSFRIMVDFVNTLSESNKLKIKLINALNSKKPFREFKFMIDNSGEYRKHWFDFKNQELCKWVWNRFDEFNY